MLVEAPGKKNDSGRRWRFTYLCSGLEKPRLPGATAYARGNGEVSLSPDDKADRALAHEPLLIVAGNRHSGISSYANWLVASERYVTLDFAWVLNSSEHHEQRLDNAARRLRDQLAEQGDEADAERDASADPIEVIRHVVTPSNGASDIAGVVLRNYDADIGDASSREDLYTVFFGRLRSFLDDTRQRASIKRIVLLGHSYRALDPYMRAPKSNLLPYAQLFTTDYFSRGEIERFATYPGNAGRPIFTSDDAIVRAQRWSGGHPLLVQALCKVAVEEEIDDVDDMIWELEDRRPLAFESWIERLGQLIRDESEVARIVGVLLHHDEMAMHLVASRIPMEELFIQGWITADGPRRAQMLRWRSDCHKHLAQIAYARR
ncbi:MAG: hypothetical protein AAF772_13130 [Acidobacteriota bacterium]